MELPNSEDLAKLLAASSKAPWGVGKMDNGYGYAVRSGDRLLCSVAARGAGIRGTSAKAKADANLIALAPALAARVLELEAAVSGNHGLAT